MTVIKLIPEKTILILCILLAVLAAVIASGNDADEIVTEDVAVETVDIQQTLTAAGEVLAAEQQTVKFSTSLVFEAMCVEEGDMVEEGQRLIKYSDGSYTYADINGIVETVTAPTTGSVADSSNSVIIADTDILAVSITVPESEINKVTEGGSATVTLSIDESESHEALIKSMQAISTAQTSSGGSEGMSETQPMRGGEESYSSGSEMPYYTVTLELKNDGSMRPGMSAVCTIVTGSISDVTAVPVEAVEYDGDQPYVNVVSGNETEKVKVSIGISDATYVEIKEGLDGSETVRIERQG